MIQLSQRIGDTKTFSIPLKWNGRPFLPENEWSLIFTAKSQPATQLDSAASLQKQLGSDFFILNDKAKIKLLPADTFGSTTITALNPGLLHWDIQAQKTQDALDIRTVASGTLNLFRDVTRGTPTYVPPSPSFSSVIPKWTSTSLASKDAYSAPFVVNTSGITISLVASNGSGGITNAKISLNSVELAGTYSSTGVWPNLFISIPLADLTGLTASYAASVAVRVAGTFNSLTFNIANAGTLTNVQPVAFVASLNAFYSQQSLPFYTTTAIVNYNYSVTSGAATQYLGTITPANSATLNATAASGALTNVPNKILTLGGSVVGTGTNGAGSTTVPITGTVSAVPVYFPAFYKNTSNSSIPTWATSDVQTASTPTGQITFPSPTAGTDYSWLATKIAASSITISTFLGPRPIEPNITSTVVISNETFYLYGFTELAPGYPIQLNFI
jgi:hypothetical protein